MIPRILRDRSCFTPGCHGPVLQEGARLYCGACSWQGTLVEPFPLETGDLPVLTSIRTRSVCLTCRRSLTDPVGCAECGVYKITTEAVHAPENPELARRGDGTTPPPGRDVDRPRDRA